MAEQKFKVGTYKVANDETRIEYAECPKYDKYVEVKAGEYPVIAYASDITSWGGANTCYIIFDEHHECWHGFIMAKSEAFTPADGWTVEVEKFIAFDGEPAELHKIVRTERIA